MLDCRINLPGNCNYNAYPRLDWFNFNLEELDAVVISHAHIQIIKGSCRQYSSMDIRGDLISETALP